MSKAKRVKIDTHYKHRGVAVISSRGDWRLPATWTSAVGTDSWLEARQGDLIAFAWGGLSNILHTTSGVLTFPADPRTPNCDLGPLEITEFISGEVGHRLPVLPPFEALLIESSRAKVAVDDMVKVRIDGQRPGNSSATGELLTIQQHRVMPHCYLLRTTMR